MAPLFLANPLLVYFRGEKTQGWVWFAVGAIALFGGWKLTQSDSKWRAIGYPLAIVGLLQAGVGAWSLLATDGRVHDLMAKMIYGTPLDLELERMTKVKRAFLIAEIVEGALFVGGLALAFATRRREQKDGARKWMAVGLGLSIQAAAMFALDFVAARRADTYLSELEQAHATQTVEVMAKWLEAD